MRQMLGVSKVIILLMHTLDGTLLVDRGRFLLYETWRVVVPLSKIQDVGTLA